MNKVCNTCHLEKPLDAFRAERLGIFGRQARLPRMQEGGDRAAHIARGESEKFRKKRWRQENLATQRECDRKWRMQNKEKIKAKTERRAPEDPMHQAARNKANIAVKKGILIKPERCQRCSAAAKLYGHHHGYSKPLEVEWLCAPCHRNEHLRLEAHD